MRLHTDLIVPRDIDRMAALVPDLKYVTVERHGSRDRMFAYEVKLSGWQGRRRNTGNRGGSDEHAATWDQWGALIGLLYGIDSRARWGSKTYPAYRDATDFHAQTFGRFEYGMPPDSHAYHRWEWRGGDAMRCRRCTAQRTHGVSWADRE